MTAADVLVVGGGPGGSACARALVGAGYNVIVLDRATFPRDKTCAGWITPPVVDLLGLSLEEYGQERVCQPLTGFRTCRMGGAIVETRFDEPVSYGICRVEFDDYLLRRSGAQVVGGMAVTSLRRAGGRWVVNDAFETPMLVGAGGHFCPVARHLGLPAHEVAVVAQEIEFHMTPAQQEACRVRPDTPELYVCRDLKGYGWVFRKGDVLNVGLGRHNEHELPKHVRAFAADMIASGTVPPDTPARWKGHAYVLRDVSTRRVADAGVLLVGDAAGLAHSVSGEGIRPAIESGLLAADVIREAAGCYDRDRLHAYEPRLEARLPRARHAALAALPSTAITAIVGRLLETSWFTRRVLLERWFLQAA
jgi:geranylgeranyl reductase family protein